MSGVDVAADVVAELEGVFASELTVDAVAEIEGVFASELTDMLNAVEIVEELETGCYRYYKIVKFSSSDVYVPLAEADGVEVVFLASEVVGLLDAVEIADLVEDVETVDVIVINNSSSHSSSSNVYVPLGEADVEVVFLASEVVGLLDAVETADLVEDVETVDVIFINNSSSQAMSTYSWARPMLR
jgi:hypothetical protein